MVSKAIIIALAAVITLSIIGTTAYYAQINSPHPLDAEKYDILTATSKNMEPTISVGNKLFIDKQVSPSDLNANYPDSDIIVFYTSSEKQQLVVSRIVSAEEVDGKLVFRTKGDSNEPKYPETPSLDSCDPGTLSEDLIFGKVIDISD